ncbi:MAG: hypothetical protein CMO61_05750 [Verrucomicrobiales bacterium]|nr:hypothetical protein [Verrucomicrobiales bacterium]
MISLCLLWLLCSANSHGLTEGAISRCIPDPKLYAGSITLAEHLIDDGAFSERMGVGNPPSSNLAATKN